MKKSIRFLIIIVLVIASVVIASTNPTWASTLATADRPAVQQAAAIQYSPVIPAQPLAGGGYAPLAYHVELSGIGTHNGNNIGGVCLYDVEFKVDGIRVVADAEVPIPESKIVPFSGDGKLLFPGCRFVYIKKDANNADVNVNPLATVDGNAKVCFGANPYYLKMTIYYYLQDPAGGAGNRVWNPLPSTIEDNGRLVCAPALYSAVYMPVGKLMPPETLAAGKNALFPNGLGGSILPPPNSITITGSGTYAVGGICLIRAKYNDNFKGLLKDTVDVEYPTKHYTENTLTIPSDSVENAPAIFYWPGCHVIHYLLEGTPKSFVIKDEMKSPDQGEWQICFAAIPLKTMTIYYYQDNLTIENPPWKPLVTTTANGMACADLVNFSAVYAPTAK